MKYKLTIILVIYLILFSVTSISRRGKKVELKEISLNEKWSLTLNSNFELKESRLLGVTETTIYLLRNQKLLIIDGVTGKIKDKSILTYENIGPILFSSGMIYFVEDKNYLKRYRLPKVEKKTWLSLFTLKLIEEKKEKKESWLRIFDYKAYIPPKVNVDQWSYHNEKISIHHLIGTDDKIILKDKKGIIVALNKSDGKKLWEIDIAKQIKIEPLFEGNYIYVFDTEKTIHKISVSDGKKILKTELPANAVSPAVYHDEDIFLGLENGHFVSIDTEDLDTSWTFDTVNQTIAKPIVHEDLIIFSSFNCHTYARNAGSGSREFMIQSKSRFFIKPLITEEILFTFPYSDRYLTYDLLNDRPLHPIKQYDETVISTLALPDENSLLLLLKDGTLKALDYTPLRTIIETYEEW